MAMSNEFSASSVPTYFIYRDVPEGQVYDPTAALAFFPPKDSDDLFFALRAKFPLVKSHADRMRDATIEFLMEEKREAEALSANVTPELPSLYDSMTDTSPWQQSWPSASMTTLSSPEMTNFATPVFGDSPNPQVPHLMRQQSSAATPNDAQTPGLDAMTSVFSLSTSEQPKQRVRRKMTESEKVEYRKRRIVKACDKCSKRKRKCVHNQPEMDDLKKSSNDKATHKVTKPRHSTAKQQHIAEASFASDFRAANTSDASATDGFTGGYEDFTLLFDDPTLDFSFDDSMIFDPQNYNTKPDKFSQCVQNFNANASNASKPHWGANTISDWSGASTNASESFVSRSHSLESADNDQAFHSSAPHSSQTANDHVSHRRCEVPHSQSESGLTSDARLANAGQLDAHGIQTAGNARNSTGGLSATTYATHTPDVQKANQSLHVDSDGRGGEDQGRLRDPVRPLLIGSDPSLADTALGEAREPAMSVLRTAAGNSPQSNSRRHRTRSDGLYDPALQSEMSLTSTTNSGTRSSTKHTATLEGRPTHLGGTPVSPPRSPHGGSGNSQHVGNASATQDCTTPSPRSSTTGPNAIVSSAQSSTVQSSRISRVSPMSNRATSSVPTEASRASSALFARTSLFDRADTSHARSTELFRLKHRMSTLPEASKPAADRTNVSGSGLSAQANGGAYPRPSSNTTPRPSGSTSTGLATQQNVRTIQATTSNTDKSKSTEASGARMLFTESDTKRYRDHHGRDAHIGVDSVAASCSALHIFALTAMAILVLIMVMSSMSPSSSTKPSISLLALLSTATIAFSNGRSAMSTPLRSTLQRALAWTRGKQDASLARVTMLRSLGCL